MHSHSHTDPHAAPDDADGRRRNEQRVFWAMLLTGVFMFAEVGGGLLSGSLALIADAGHMLTDTVALGFSWMAFRMARRPADAQRTYGYHRYEVLAAFLNGAALLVITLWIAVEAIERLRAPVHVMGGIMLGIASAGLAVNLGAFAILHGGERHNLNIRGAIVHVVGDLLGSAATIVAAVVILLTGWMPIDPILSLLVAALILRSAWVIFRRSGHILLEGTPDEIDVAQVRASLKEAVPEVDDIHHVHAWSLSSGRPVMTLHAHVREGADDEHALRGIRRLLAERFGIDHATVQIERGRCTDETTTKPGESQSAAQNH